MAFSLLCKPTVPIGFGAMGAHHITEAEVAQAPDIASVVQRTLPQLEPSYVVAAHNAAFDKSFLLPHAPHLADWICTYRCAMHLWPDAESYKNQSLRYELGLDVSDMPPEAGGMAHRALYDAWVTYKLLERMLESRTVSQLVELTKAPILLKKCGFGKHVGTLWEDVPASYLRWMLSQDFDEDTLYTARFYLR
jgi:exodeoxyribonuclease X